MKYIFGLVFSFLSIFKWIWKNIICCGRRHKEESTLPFTVNNGNVAVKYAVPSNNVELDNWDSNWGNDQSKVEESLDGSNENKEIDYFTDMIPKFVKAKKVLVPPNNHMSNHQNLFAIQLNAVSDKVGNELKAWDEVTSTPATSWGVEATEDLTEQCEATEKQKRHDRRKLRQNKETLVPC